MDYKAKIMEFFVNKNKSEGLSYDTDLFKGGFINSLFALEMVVYLEKTFDIKIKNKDITEKNFKTIENIANIVMSYKGE